MGQESSAKTMGWARWKCRGAPGPGHDHGKMEGGNCAGQATVKDYLQILTMVGREGILPQASQMSKQSLTRLKVLVLVQPR